LDLEGSCRKRLNLFATNRRKPPKLVHRLICSMPRARPPLAAVRDFAREEFRLKRRYAMVLHTDEPHPHVQVVKALSEDGCSSTFAGNGNARHLLVQSGYQLNS